MSQDFILRLLEKHPKKWFTIKEVVGHLKQNKNLVTSKLNRLYDQGYLRKRWFKCNEHRRGMQRRICYKLKEAHHET